MRVIAGTAKGHRLETIEGLATRPTTDRIKETLFNIIAFDLPDCRFLDVFSGSGAIGIEALSRGAKEAVFVEHAPECQEVIVRNLEHTRLKERGRLLKEDVLSALNRLGGEKLSFDLIYLDPPYEEGLAKPTLEAILKNGLLTKEGYIILERGAKQPLELPEGYTILREKEYRTTVLTFLCLEEEI